MRATPDGHDKVVSIRVRAQDEPLVDIADQVLDIVFIEVDRHTERRVDDARAREMNIDTRNDIAVFLSEANPNWSKKEIVGMFNDHLALTTKEAASRLNKKWPDDIAAFDEILRQMMMMADDLSNGIIKQFPDQF